MNSSTNTFIRAELISFARNPGDGDTPEPGSLEHYDDGLLWLKGQYIHAVGHFAELAPSLPKGADVLAILAPWMSSFLLVINGICVC